MLLTSVTDSKTFTFTSKAGEELDLEIGVVTPEEWRALSDQYGIIKTVRREQLKKRIDPALARRYQDFYIDAASIALRDTNPKRIEGRGADIPARTEEVAALFAKELGRSVKVGEVVNLDGHWTKDLKRYVFHEMPGGPAFRDRVLECAERLGFDAAEEEEGKG
jgi:hypothetical protein